MVRKVISAKRRNISIQVPENFVGKQVEVIAFTLENEDALEETVNADKTTTHLANSETLAKDWLSPIEDRA